MFNEGHFSLILMDLQMPLLSGIEATVQIRKMEKSQNIPIIALTANVFDDDKRKCFEVGMNDFMPKPIDRKKFIEMIQRYID